MRYTQCDDATCFDDVQVLVLDTMGMLSSVYGSATWAYIGGGFGVGIHNTLEAATFGLPSLSAPTTRSSRRRATWCRSAAPCRCIRPMNWRRGSPRCATTEEALRRASRTAKDYTARNQGATGIILRSVFPA